MRTAAIVIGFGMLAGLMGCDMKTGDQWGQRMVLATDMTPSAVEGRWEGSWQSYESWDNGLIHFVITPSDVAEVPTTLPAVASPAAPGTRRYLAHVKLWHWGLLATEEFNMVLIGVTGTNGEIEFHGERDLGPLNGFCKFDGTVGGAKVSMSYVSRGDFGSVVLKRVVKGGS